MRVGTAVAALLLSSAPALAQKWVDEKGRVYYGEPPNGVKVKPAEMKGGGSGVASSEDLERQLRERNEAKAASAGAGGNRKIPVRPMVEYKPDLRPPDPSLK